jgi:phosphate transport system substrate-binding protein
MSRTPRTTLGTLALLGLAVLLAGCGKTADTTAGGAPAPSGKAPTKAAQAPADTKAKAGATVIQAKGSDTLLQVAQALAEAYKKLETGVDVTVTGGGSGTGFKAILDGTADIADSSRKIKDEETKAAKDKGIELVENLIAYDGIAVIVNKANPIEKVTVDELAALYTATTTDWTALGGKGEVVLLSRDSTSGTHEYFKEHVLNKGDSKGKEDFAASAVMVQSNDQIRSQVAETAGAIGYIGLGYVDDSVKVVPIVGKDGKAVSPSIATVKDGTYPISRPLFMYTKRDASAAITKLIEWIKGAEGQKIVKDQGFVPL